MASEPQAGSVNLESAAGQLFSKDLANDAGQNSEDKSKESLSADSNSTHQPSETLRPPPKTGLMSSDLRHLLPNGTPSPQMSAYEIPRGTAAPIGMSSGPTTAVNLETVGVDSFIDEFERANQPLLVTTRSNKSSISHSTILGANYSSDEHDDSNYIDQSRTQDEEDLQNVLNDLIRNESRHNGESSTTNPISYVDLNISNTSEKLNEDEFYRKYIQIDKGKDEVAFHKKLKQFFILSSAGKPIYSMNGADDLIIGYMGIITTIVSTFEENVKDEIKSVTLGENLKLVVLNKNEMILVAITKISYELMTPTNDREENNENEGTLVKQLNILYNYFLSILSKPSLKKNFHNRMNYDLRKVLTALDFHNLDNLCMKLTYGLEYNQDENVKQSGAGFDYFASQLLGSSLQNIKITNTSRSQLNNILLSTKRLKVQKSKQTDKLEKLSSFFGMGKEGDEEKYVSEDLLFAFLTVSSKILSFLKPKNHDMTNQDIASLFAMIESTESHGVENDTVGDLWFPLCMPNFSENGFLYVFVRKFYLGDYIGDHTGRSAGPPMTIILVSSNKNTFFEMQEISKYIIYKMIKKEKFKTKLYKELILSTKLSILHDIKVPVIKHFIYKVTKKNQFIMSDMVHYNNKADANSYLQLVYFYSMLHNTKVKKVLRKKDSNNLLNQSFSHNKRLTYTKWNNNVTGFMLSDDAFEFYCICTDKIDSRDLISHSLKVINWCETNYKRLFIGEGISF